MNKNYTPAINAEDVQIKEGAVNAETGKRTVKLSWLNPFDEKYFELELENNYEKGTDINSLIHPFREYVYSQYIQEH